MKIRVVVLCEVLDFGSSSPVWDTPHDSHPVVTYSQLKQYWAPLSHDARYFETLSPLPGCLGLRDHAATIEATAHFKFVLLPAPCNGRSGQSSICKRKYSNATPFLLFF
jgi:hypothetical protein